MNKIWVDVKNEEINCRLKSNNLVDMINSFHLSRKRSLLSKYAA